MRRAAALCAACACLVVAGAVSAPVAGAASGRYVVVFHEGYDPVATTNRLVGAFGIRPSFRYDAALGGFAAVLSDSQRGALAADPAVDFVGEDVAVQASGTAPLAAGETVPPGIRRVGAATLTEAHGAADAPVAVLDSGVDLRNADLNAVSGKNCVSTTATAQDDNGHGTNVAGILAARNAGSGVTGVAPGTRIYSVKVLNSKNSGTLSQILCGIDWVTANAAALGIKVANISVQGSGANDNDCGNRNNDAWHKAICRSVAAGVTYVASAGNSKTTLDKTIPAAYPEVLAVTAMTDTDGLAGAKGGAPKCKSGEADDRYASFSNYAANATAIAHTLAAPGTCVVSDKLGGGTSTYYGTSQAAPHAAGTLALCFGSGGAGPCAGLTPSQAIARVRADAAAAAAIATGFAGDPLRPVSGKYFGHLAAAAAY
ncbi:MAG TPA: S8 family serine peptidase [Thermoleophilaceae bacterium]|nr:S8 family serine peptidase [Thermoleophilaceae bacterium]